MTIEQALERATQMVAELKALRYAHYRMQWPKGRSDDPGPPPGLEDYVKTIEDQTKPERTEA